QENARRLVIRIQQRNRLRDHVRIGGIWRLAIEHGGHSQWRGIMQAPAIGQPHLEDYIEEAVGQRTYAVRGHGWCAEWRVRTGQIEPAGLDVDALFDLAHRGWHS